MWNEAIKLALAGLMVALELTGVDNANDRILSLADQLGVKDSYIIETVMEPVSVAVDVSLPTAIPYPVDKLNYPIIEASSAVVIDQATGSVLFAKNIHETRAMASLTKLMTALVVMDEKLLSDVVTVEAEDTYIEPNVMGLSAGEEITVENLLWGLIINSSNDAALTLARYTAGSVAGFIEMMNERALEMGLENTRFANPHGLDAPEHFSTARDLAILAREISQDKLILQIASTTDATVYSTDGTIAHRLKTTNELLDSYLPIEGLKTGFTDEAGQSVIELADNGHPVIVVLLNSPDRFQEAKMLVDWVYRNYYWE